MSRSYRTRAIVMRRTNLGEADRILTLFSRDRGKMSAVAKGSRRIQSSLSGASELFSYGVFQVAAGASLDLITQGELKTAFLGLRTSLERLSRALYLLEFCAAFLEEHQPHQELFDLLHSGLLSLEKGLQLDWIIAAFEVQAMVALGYGLQLTECVLCGRREPAARYAPSLGGVLCAGCAGSRRDSMRISSEAVQAMAWLGGCALPAAGMQTVAEPLLVEVRRVVRTHIRHHAEREMRSTDFIEQVRAESETARTTHSSTQVPTPEVD